VTIVDLLYPRLRAHQRSVGVVGHRGSRATDAENTVGGFRRAIEFGADAVELDVVVTTDSQLAVTHDPVDTAFGELAVKGIPRLEEVLALAPGNGVVFDIEMKESGRLTPAPDIFARMLLERIQDPGLQGRVMVRSFEHSFLRAVHALNPELPLVALVEGGSWDWQRVCAEANAVCISPRFEDVTAKAVAAAHERRLAVMPWTVNDAGDWKRMIERGADAIITDDPAALVRFLSEQRV
jgi:glycerophosphoryl diester phosphodiesterase